MNGQSQPGPGTADEAEAPSTARGVETADEATFRKFHHDQDRNLHRFLARRLPPNDQEDVRQETWQSFYLAWTGNPGHPNPTALLFQIASCRVTDQHRKAHRTPSPLDGEDLQILIDALMTEVPQDLVDSRQDLERALGQLTARQRLALELRLADDMPVAAVAGLMGLGVDNTKRILKRAIKDLRMHMASYYQAATEPRREQK